MEYRIEGTSKWEIECENYQEVNGEYKPFNITLTNVCAERITKFNKRIELRLISTNREQEVLFNKEYRGIKLRRISKAIDNNTGSEYSLCEDYYDMFIASYDKSVMSNGYETYLVVFLKTINLPSEKEKENN